MVREIGPKPPWLGPDEVEEATIVDPIEMGDLYHRGRSDRRNGRIGILGHHLRRRDHTEAATFHVIAVEAPAVAPMP